MTRDLLLDKEIPTVADKKTWAIILGTTAGVATTVALVRWYMHSHSGSTLKTVQDKIQWAHEKLDELEQVASSLKKPLSAT